MKTITKLAVRNLNHEKSRSILTVIAIFLTTCLLTIITQIGYQTLNFEKLNAGRMNGEYYARYFYLDSSTVEALKSDPRILTVGSSQDIAEITGFSADAVLMYMDSTAMQLHHFIFEEGTSPQKKYEITATKEMFELLGIKEPKISDRVQISYRISKEHPVQTEEFIISGFLASETGMDLSNMHSVFVSKEWLYETVAPEQHSYCAYIKTLDKNPENNQKFNSEQMGVFLKEIANEYGIPDSCIDANSALLIWTLEPSYEVIITCVFISLLVVLFSIIVIYNIFYVGIVQKVQEYGKLRALGTTKKQLKSLLRKEGLLLCLVGIPAGLCLGSAASIVILKKIIIQDAILEQGATITKMTLISPLLLCCCAALSVLAVLLGLKKPMRLAIGISPVEAMRYQEQEVAQKSRDGYQKLNLLRLTKANLSRNKKRTRMTILTMGLSCVLFVTVANVTANMDAEREARVRYIEKGDFKISLKIELNDPVYPENNLSHVQQLGLLDEKFIEQLYQIPGVTNVEKRKYLHVNLTNAAEEDTTYGTIVVMNREDFKQIEENLESGTADYDELTRQGGIVYLWADYWRNIFGYEYGNSMKFELFVGDRIIALEAPLAGSTSFGDATYAMTEDTYLSLGISEDTTTELFISCEKKSLKKVQQQIQELIQKNNLYQFISYQESVELLEELINMLRSGAYALLFVLGLIGFMNLANTLITSIITRKRELGILQAIGMTTKQMQKMLTLEGLLFTAGTLIIALTVGNGLGYLAFQYMKKQHIIGVFEYNIPFVELAIMTFLIAGLQILLSYVMSRKMQKDSLTERIRHQE